MNYEIFVNVELQDGEKCTAWLAMTRAQDVFPVPVNQGQSVNIT